MPPETRRSASMKKHVCFVKMMSHRYPGACPLHEKAAAARGGASSSSMVGSGTSGKRIAADAGVASYAAAAVDVSGFPGNASAHFSPSGRRKQTHSLVARRHSPVVRTPSRAAIGSAMVRSRKSSECEDAARVPLDIDKIIKQLLGSRKKVEKQASCAQLVLTEGQARQLCLSARDVFLQQPMLLELEAPVNIVGDIHGQFEDLLRHFDKLGYPPQANYLFLGDYVDRGRNSLEVISLLLAYKLKYPNNFFLLRGNHECASINRVYGFYEECKRRYSIKLWKTFTDLFNCLPVAALVEGTIFCTHGGLSPQLNDLNEIRNIPRPIDVPDSGLICDLLWSDPAEGLTGWAQNDRGVSFVFGRDVVARFLHRHGCSLIVRAHQVVEDGYQFFAERSLLTLFSAPNYCGEFDNAGAVLGVSEDLTCWFSVLPPVKKKMFVRYK